MSNDPFSYVIDKVNIYIHGQTEVLNVAGSLLELELMEDIDNLHITGSLSFLDTNNVFENVDFDGTEYVQISAILPDSPSDRWSSWFHVVRVMKTSKGNDTAEAITVELIDRDSYINNLINVNKSYAGKITLMMDNILRDNFKAQKRMMFSTQDIQEPILYIPPNLTPYQTLKVLRSRCTGPTGTPFYLFAVLNDNRLRFFDLFDMLNLPSINQGSPYTFNQRATDTGDVQDTSYHITTLDIRNTEDMMTLIRKGMVGAEYNYVNTTGGYVDIVKYDAQKVVDNIWKYSTQKTLAPVVNVNAMASGTYAVQIYANDYSLGGGHYYEYYSGTMSYYGGSTNSTHTDEVVLHRAGHAPNNGHIQLRTERHGSGVMQVQIKHNIAYNAAADQSSGKQLSIKFRRLI